MDLGRLPLFAMMANRLAWLDKRQEVLATNVANADTPGYRARDLKMQSFRDLVSAHDEGAVRMVATDPGHLRGIHGDGPAFKVAVVKDAPVSISGNSVDLEQQMMQVAKTAMDHRLTINLYRKRISMIKTALGRN